MASETGLSMLWESADPATALSARFGFSETDRAVSWFRRTIEQDWSRELDQCDRLVISASNLLAWLTIGGKQVIAKCSGDPARFARLAEVDAVVGWLDSEHIPVAAPIAARDGRRRVECEGFSLGLYPRVEGDLLDVGDSSQVQAAGETLARLHDALAAYPGPLGGSSTLPNQQLVHGDFRSANVLHDGSKVTAVLDFEEATTGSRISDLAKATVLLATRYQDWRPTDPDTRETFVAGYSDVTPLTGAQRDELDRCVTTVLKHFGWA